MVYELLHHDLTGFTSREVPNTAALTDQIANSLQGEERWLFDVLERGWIMNSAYSELSSFPEDGWMPAGRLLASYEQWMKGPYKATSTAIGKLMTKLGIEKSTQRVGDWAITEVGGSLMRNDKGRMVCYRLGTLAEMKQRFAKEFKVQFSYMEDDEDDAAQTPAADPAADAAPNVTMMDMRQRVVLSPEHQALMVRVRENAARSDRKVT
jgi:hypothetical protein